MILGQQIHGMKPMEGKMQTILLLGNYRPAIALARALAADGYRIMLGLEGEEPSAERSRFVNETWDHPLLSTCKATFLEALVELLDQRSDICAVIPVAEEFVLFLATHEKRIKAKTLLASPRQDIIEIFHDKQIALDFAKKTGVAMLPYKIVSDYKSLKEATQQIGFPITIRAFGATARIGQKKALILENPESLRKALPTWPDGHDRLLLQRFAQGRRHNIYFAAERGELCGMVESRIFRTDHPDGTGLAVDGETVPLSDRLVDETRKLVSATNYSGIGLTQFIVDPRNGAHCFLELNARVSGSHNVPELAGLPLSKLAIELAEREQLNPATKSEFPVFAIRTGLRYAWTDGDLWAAKLALLRGDISFINVVIWTLKALGLSVRADIHMVWSWRDPMPALISLNRLLPRLLRIEVPRSHRIRNTNAKDLTGERTRNVWVEQLFCRHFKCSAT